jgi:hypothetical protein
MQPGERARRAHCILSARFIFIRFIENFIASFTLIDLLGENLAR